MLLLSSPATLLHERAGAVVCLQQAVSLYTDMGRLGMAARQLRVRWAVVPGRYRDLPDPALLRTWLAAPGCCWHAGLSSRPHLACRRLPCLACTHELACTARAGWKGAGRHRRVRSRRRSRGAQARAWVGTACSVPLPALQEIAEVMEKEGNKEESIMFYEQAADLFATENSTSEANKCNLKVGRATGPAAARRPGRPGSRLLEVNSAALSLPSPVLSFVSS